MRPAAGSGQAERPSRGKGAPGEGSWLRTAAGRVVARSRATGAGAKPGTSGRGALLAWIALLAVGCPAAATAAPLTVVAFNVESGGSSDIVVGRQLERSSDVDLWGLTEIYRAGGWVEKMQAAAGVGEGVEFGAVVGRTGRDNENLVLYRSDRLRLLESEELTDAARGRGQPAPLVARFLLDGSQEFLFVVVRFSDWAPTRREQAEVLGEWGAAQTLPVVAVGTFAFGVPEGGTAGDEAMAGLVARTGWRWIRPADAFATACGHPPLVQDFVFAGGAARDWAGQADVMFRQNNYCADGAGRSSDFRPVLAGFRTDGEPGPIVGAMPLREIGPVLPGVVQEGVIEARDGGGDPDLITKAGDAPPAVAEAGARPPPAQPALPVPPVPETSATPTAGPAPRAADREALLRRLEALEQENENLRRALEEARGRSPGETPAEDVN
jgi:hypothetical protein